MVFSVTGLFPYLVDLILKVCDLIPETHFLFHSYKGLYTDF